MCRDDLSAIADLPAPGTTRWMMRRKAETIAAVRGGLISLEEACSRYMLTIEELLAWQCSIDRHGLASPGCGRPASSNIAVAGSGCPVRTAISRASPARDR
jgi:Protein of unknown function (DUF1153)